MADNAYDAVVEFAKGWESDEIVKDAKELAKKGGKKLKSAIPTQGEVARMKHDARVKAGEIMDELPTEGEVNEEYQLGKGLMQGKLNQLKQKLEGNESYRDASDMYNRGKGHMRKAGKEAGDFVQDKVDNINKMIKGNQAQGSGLGWIIAQGATRGSNDPKTIFGNMMQMASKFNKLSPELEQAQIQEQVKYLDQLSDKAEKQGLSEKEKEHYLFLTKKIQAYQAKMQQGAPQGSFNPLSKQPTPQPRQVVPQQQQGFDPLGVTDPLGVQKR